MLISGATGAGKTYLACALAQAAIRRGHKALYWRLPRLLDALRLAHADGTAATPMNSWARIDVLVLDDLGLRLLTTAQAADLLEVIEDRHQRRSTILTSQLPINTWHDNLGEPTLADAICDRSCTPRPASSWRRVPAQTPAEQPRHRQRPALTTDTPRLFAFDFANQTRFEIPSHGSARPDLDAVDERRAEAARAALLGHPPRHPGDRTTNPVRDDNETTTQRVVACPVCAATFHRSAARPTARPPASRSPGASAAVRSAPARHPRYLCPRPHRLPVHRLRCLLPRPSSGAPTAPGPCCPGTQGILWTLRGTAHRRGTPHGQVES